MAVKCIKIPQQGGQASIVITEAQVPKNGKTIIRKKPYKGGLCYRHKHKKSHRRRSQVTNNIPQGQYNTDIDKNQ